MEYRKQETKNTVLGMYLLISTFLTFPMSSANMCCKSLTISSTNNYTAEIHAKRLTTYKRKFHMGRKPSYLSSDNDTILFYGEKFQEWTVANKDKKKTRNHTIK